MSSQIFLQFFNSHKNLFHFFRLNSEDLKKIEDCDERARLQRAREIADGIEVIQTSTGLVRSPSTSQKLLGSISSNLMQQNINSHHYNQQLQQPQLVPCPCSVKPIQIHTYNGEVPPRFHSQDCKWFDCGLFLWWFSKDRLAV